MTTKNNPELLESIESTFDSAAHELIQELSGDNRNKAYDLYSDLAHLIQDNLQEKFSDYKFQNF